MRYFKFFYFYLILILSGYSTTFLRSQEGLIVIFIIGLFIFGDTLLKPTKTLLYALGVWMIYFIINTIVIKHFHPFFMITYIIYIIIAWWLISYFKEKIFIKFEDTIYFLSIISLVFYSWHVIHFESLYSLIKFFDLSQNMFPDRGYASIIIYSIRDMDQYSIFPRNSGFTWEPGPFSSYVALAVFFNLARNKLVLKDKLRLAIFLFTIITTQSTTGVISIFIIILWLAWFKFKNNNIRYLLFPMAITILILIFFYTPFLQEKIIGQIQPQLSNDELIENSIKYERVYGPGRIASFQLGWRDFKNHPLVGIGGHTESQYAIQQGAEVSTINGLAMIMTRYGLTGLILFLMLIFNTGKWLANYYSYGGLYIFPALILIISFSFIIIETPLLVTIWISSIFLKNPNFYSNKSWVKKYYSF